MKTYSCPICKGAFEIVKGRTAHDNAQLELYCEPCDVLVELTYDDSLPIRLEGSE